MKRLSIRSKLVLSGLIAVLLPLYATGWLAIKDSSKTLEKTAYASATANAVKTADTVSEIVQTQKKIVWALASDTLVQNTASKVQQYGWKNLPEDIDILNKKIQATYTNFQDKALGIFITDAKGYLYTGIRQGGKDYKGSNIQGRAYFQQAKETGKPVVSDIVKSKSTGAMISIAAAPIYGPSHEFMGIYAIAFKSDWYSNVVLAQQFGKTGRAFMVNADSLVIAHPNKDMVFQLHIAKTPGLEDLAARIAQRKPGTSSYVYKNIDIVTAFAPITGTPWNLAVSQNRSEVLASNIQLRNKILTVALISALIVTILIFWATRFIVASITGPISDVVARLRDIAQGEGDLTMRLDIISKDELGELASWFNVFIEKMQGIIAKVSENTNEVDEGSKDLSGIAEEFASLAQSSSSRVKDIADSTEELNTNLTTVAAAMEESTANASMVASSSEEMSATISQIAANVEEASQISASAVTQAENTSRRMGELEEAAQSISKVTEAITDISDKTNLLALNATIEAARAGEAGKGFAVVATEIKELAAQTAQATNDIKNQIDGIQATSTMSISAINEIVTIINQVNDIISTITTAVGEQSSATQEITSNIAQASQGLMEINENVNQGSAISGEITQRLSQSSSAAVQMSEKSTAVTNQAAHLQELATALKGIVNSFKI